MNEYNEEKIIQQLKAGLDNIDDKIEVKIPEMNYFRDMVSKTEEKKRARSRKEFLVFFIVALAFLSFFTFAYYNYSVVFLVIQMVSILFIPVGLYTWFRKQRKQVI